MLNIKFKIDKNILARLVISKNYMPKEFANYLWDKYRLSYVVLQRNYKLEQIDNNIIKELQNQKFFKDYCDEAEQNLKRIQTNWLKNSEKINKFLTNIFKKDFLLDMTIVGDAIDFVCNPKRINYEILGNSDEFLHAHIFPRYLWEEERVKRPVWLYPRNNWTDLDKQFFNIKDGELLRKRIKEKIEEIMNEVYK